MHSDSFRRKSNKEKDPKNKTERLNLIPKETRQELKMWWHLLQNENGGGLAMSQDLKTTDVAKKITNWQPRNGKTSERRQMMEWRNDTVQSPIYFADVLKKGLLA
ncbi:hypothetical protein ElyMa_002608100 [Elysia marginata]|uniref:Uncharacterized protein n=1 Tax=Elysia marginata TaxID=1093978 RepID=A0AAV4H3Z6_9GAST|nr:hypothetical protein ElyMa_002608100 [Elysia marginata]